MASEGEFAGTPAAARTCGGARRAACGGCDSCCGPSCGECCDFGWEVFDGHCGPFLRGVSIFAGLDGFKSDGTQNNGSNNALPNKNGTFGVNEGINMARPLGDPWGCGYQIGANFVQSDFAGNASNTDGELRPLRPIESNTS